MQLWDKLLPQTIVTLNILSQSNAVPSVSACQYVRRNFDYNKSFSDQWEVQNKSMKAETTEAHGLNNQLMDDTSEHQWSITNVTSLTSRKQRAKEYQTWYISSTNTLHNQHLHQFTLW
jgi:hypothetical protein